MVQDGGTPQPRTRCVSVENERPVLNGFKQAER